MGGGLMQLVAYGAQDIYLTGNPQITFFKVVYRRHTNFSIESIDQTLNGTVSATGSNLSATIARNGDLISNMHFDVDITGFDQTVTLADQNYLNWTDNTGHALFKDIELEIGGQQIDKHYGHWLDVWNELTDHDNKEHDIINKHYNEAGELNDNSNDSCPSLKLMVPLKFWFNRNPGLALPLIALQYHEVKLKFETRNLLHLLTTDSTAAGNFASTNMDGKLSLKLYVDYIYLDTDERRRFAQQSHEYLIEQLQYSNHSDSTGNTSVKLNLNHPVKELVWTIQQTAVTTETTNAKEVNSQLSKNDPSAEGQKNDYFNYSSGPTGSTSRIRGKAVNEAFSKMTLELNGHTRFNERDAVYFRYMQPLQAGHRIPQKNVYVYSFALKPEEHQPSGTCNFSRIDNAQMKFANAFASSANPKSMNVYAVNYNVLRIMSGMGGLAYSN